jgi:rhodanese-related sulfurtransferase/molybdopterin converting factor small subunit
MLAAICEGARVVAAQGATVREVLVDLTRQYPLVRRHLYDDGGELRGYVNIYRNDEDVRYLEGLSTPVRPGDVIVVVPSVAGGAQTSDDSGMTPQVSARELKLRLDAGERIRLLDVREPFEWDIANLGEEGAELIPMGELGLRLGELNPLEELVVYCHSGIRSAAVVRHLRDAGFSRVWNLAGGITAWATEVDPSMRVY